VDSEPRFDPKEGAPRTVHVMKNAAILLLGLVAACLPDTAAMVQPSSGGVGGVGGGAGANAGVSGMAQLPSGGAAGSPPIAATDAGMIPTGGTGGAPALDAAVTDATTPVDASVPSFGVGFVGEHGPLRVSGNRVIDAHGQPIQLRGMSLFWTQWTDFYMAKNVDVLVDDWKATVVRAALGVENDGGYLANQQANIDKVRAIVDRAIARGVYVIIDWHDHHAQDHAAQARTFFEQMARDYGKEPSVIFEVYNEPMDVEWPVVKTYAEDLIAVIREAGSDNLIIVGTPTWSQDVDVAAADPITSDDNVAYTLHFYADTHKQPLRNKAMAALNAGIALFVTEWGTCSADGNGAINEAETQAWLTFMRERSISWANWSLHDKAEACSAIASGGGSTGPWRDDQLTASGRLVKPAIP
jgi:endoglucanase